MTDTFLTLNNAAFAWPDGQRLFSQLDLQLDRRPTGLVGRNGAGKSVLARLIAGELVPTAGRCEHTGAVGYVPQHITCLPGATVASVAGVQPVLDALARIEAGSVDAADFEQVGERWGTRQQLVAWLTEQGLGYLSP